MALKDTWKDLVDNVDDIEVKPINDIAHSVISNEENKLDKVTSNGSLRAYGVNDEGNQTVISTTTSGEENALLLTDENGNSSVADPTEDDHIANKKFVDEENAKQNNMFANALKGEASGEMVLLTEVSPIEHEVKVKLRSKNLLQTNNGTYDNDSYNHYKITVENGHYDVETKKAETYDTMRDFWTQMGSITLTKGDYRLSQYNNTFDDTFGQFIIVLKDISTNTTVLELYKHNTTKTFTVNEESITVVPTIYTFTNTNVGTYPFTFSFDLMLTKGTEEEEEEFTPSVPSDATVTLTTRGKNLLQYPYPLFTEEKTVAGVTYTPLPDGGIKANGVPTGMGTLDLGYVKMAYNCAPVGDTKIKGTCVAASDFKTSSAPWLYSDSVSNKFWLRHWFNESFDNYIFYPQAEIGSKFTEYEPPKPGETIITTLAEGAVLKNIYPNMSIIPDIEGVVVDVEYIKDSNMVVNKLMDRIAALEAAAIS